MNSNIQNLFTSQVKKNKPIQVNCDNCRKVFYLANAMAEREIDYTDNNGDTWIIIIEVGLTCPHCESYFHSYYTNQALKDRIKGLTNNRRRRAFQRDFDAWQVEARRMLETK